MYQKVDISECLNTYSTINTISNKQRGIKLPTEVDYTKVNATYESKHVLNILAAERGKSVYMALDEILRKHYSEYFERIKC